MRLCELAQVWAFWPVVVTLARIVSAAHCLGDVLCSDIGTPPTADWVLGLQVECARGMMFRCYVIRWIFRMCDDISTHRETD